MDQTTIEQVIAGAAGRPALTEIESKRLLEAAGITTAMAEHARTADEAVAAAVRAGLPAVLKVLSPDISHKSEAGGVMLQLRSERRCATLSTVSATIWLNTHRKPVSTA